MLSPRALQLLIKHLDSVDKVLVSKMMRKNPWSEDALSFLLCDLLDSETQNDTPVEYPFEQLLSDFAQTDEPLHIRIDVETNKYNSYQERWVTQSDLGFIVKYQDNFDAQHSFTQPWLLQAKRLFPNVALEKGAYNTNANFQSYDSEQHERMKGLRDWVGFNFIIYLLYCPRPTSLAQPIRATLNRYRTDAVKDDIFDYAIGRLLQDDILSEAPTTAAGMFLAPIDGLPKNLGEVHQKIFRGTTPLSWFIIQHFVDGEMSAFRKSPVTSAISTPLNQKILAERLVRGDQTALYDSELEYKRSENPPRILPARTITVEIKSGVDLLQG